MAVLAGRDLRLPGPGRRLGEGHGRAVPPPRSGLPPRLTSSSPARAAAQPRKPPCRVAPAVARRLSRVSGSAGEDGPGLQQRLEVADDPGPAAATAAALVLVGTGDDRGQFRRTGHLVGDGEPADAGRYLGDLVGEPGE